MALDFNEFDVDNPHDPEFHQALAGQRVIVYYPSTTAEFWDIMRNGINLKPTIKREYRDQEIFFNTTPASDFAHGKAYAQNHEDHNGPIKPLLLVAEVKFAKPHKVGKGQMAQLVGDVMGAEANTVLPLRIEPRQIFGVVYPAASDQWETPIKKFIQQAQAGDIPGLEPDPSFGKFRPSAISQENWQHVIVRYVNDLLNYSANLFDYLLGREAVKLNDRVIREATKLGLQNMLHWDGRQMMKWLYSILPYDAADSETTPEEDIENIMRSNPQGRWDLPLYQLFKKYSDNSTWEYRTGKKEPPRRGDTGDF